MEANIAVQELTLEVQAGEFALDGERRAHEAARSALDEERAKARLQKEEQEQERARLEADLDKTKRALDDVKERLAEAEDVKEPESREDAA